MEWDETRSALLTACGKCLDPHEYKLVKSRKAFEKSTADERRGVYIIFTGQRNYRLRVWCGVRNNAIEKQFHRTSGVETKYRANYTTINLDCGEYWDLNTTNEIIQAVANAKRFITETAIPFLEKEYTYQDYCKLLNTNPCGICPFHGNPENRCHYGLIAAKFAADSAYKDLKRIYSDYLRSTNNGFYFPRFERLITDLDS